MMRERVRRDGSDAQSKTLKTISACCLLFLLLLLLLKRSVWYGIYYFE